MKSNCLNCAFLQCSTRSQPDKYEPISNPARYNFRQGVFTSDGIHRIGCYKGIFKGIGTGTGMDAMLTRLSKDRSGLCFFYPKQDQLQMEGADALQKQSLENIQLMNEIKRTNKGLCIAAAGLIIGAIFEALNYFCPNSVQSVIDIIP